MPRRLQLAIQGGGAKICHLLATMEAIQDLERNNEIKITRIAGTSAGAIVACMYAAKIDFAGFRQTLQKGLGRELLDIFKPPNRLVMGYSIVTGRPFWDEEKLKKVFDGIFKPANVSTIGDLKTLSGIEVLVIASNMLEGGQAQSKPGDFISNALLHSAGLPFCFRTWNGGIVDGGICDNFPWEALGKASTSVGEPIVGIVFDRARPQTPKNVLAFAAGLLDLAIDNTMEQAKQRLGADLLFSVRPTVTTFDFARALDRGLEDAYDRIRDKARDFFFRFGHDLESQRTGSDVWAGNISIMKRVADIYNRQHKGSLFNYELCEFEVDAHSLHGSADVVRYSARFRTGKDPIYCHAIAVSEARHKTQIDETSWWMLDDQGKTIKCLYLPMQDDDTQQSRELLIFFDPVLEPNKGPFTLSIKDEVEGLMKPLKETGNDELVFTPQRASGPVKQINLVVHYPSRYKVAFIAKEQGQPGAPLMGLELGEYRRRAPNGFDTIGWKGVNLDPNLPFGADLRRIG